MAPSIADQLKERVKRHQQCFKQSKIAKEKAKKGAQAISEHLRLVQQALQDIGAEKENPADIRILTSTFDKMKM